MDNKLDSYLRIFRNNEWIIDRNPRAYELMYENQILFERMLTLIPDSHYDEINLIVYGIRRV